MEIFFEEHKRLYIFSTLMVADRSKLKLDTLLASHVILQLCIIRFGVGRP
jgi:hypothetical protein